MSLKRIIEKTDTPAGRAFDITIQLLIVTSIVSFTIETLPDLSAKSHRILRWIEIVTVAIFTVEYVLRLIVADDRWKFIRSPFGIIDLVAILPFYISTGIDLRSVRILRILRIFRILKFVRYSRALGRLGAALRLVKEELIVFGMACVFLVYVSAVGIYYLEQQAQPDVFKSVFHCMWWAVATLTTVGYGDVFPITPGGQIFTFVILMIGLGIVAVPAGLLATALSQLLREENAAKKELSPEG